MMNDNTGIVPTNNEIRCPDVNIVHFNWNTVSHSLNFDDIVITGIQTSEQRFSKTPRNNSLGKHKRW